MSREGKISGWEIKYRESDKNWMEFILLTEKREKQICKHFGCGRELTMEEKRFGDKCIHHSIKIIMKKVLMVIDSNQLLIHIGAPEYFNEELIVKYAKDGHTITTMLHTDFKEQGFVLYEEVVLTLKPKTAA